MKYILKNAKREYWMQRTREFACQSIRHVTGINYWTGIIRQTEPEIPFYNQSINLFAWNFKLLFRRDFKKSIILAMFMIQKRKESHRKC